MIKFTQMLPNSVFGLSLLTAADATAAKALLGIVGGLDYRGTWDANANSPALASGVGSAGDFYKVSVAGTTNIDGITQWDAGDTILFEGTTWQKLDGGSVQTATSLKLNANVTALPTALTGTLLQIGNVDGTPARVELVGYATPNFFTSVRINGTAALPSGVSAGDQIGGYNAYGRNSVGNTVGPIASFRSYALDTLTGSAQGGIASIAACATGASTLIDMLTVYGTTGVGIGLASATTVPGAKLEVNGTLLIGGAATFSSTINKYTLTPPASGATLTIADGKTLTVNQSLTLTGTSGTTQTFPATSAIIARTDTGQTFTGTNAFGILTGTSLALGGATIGTDALGVTGTASISGNATFAGQIIGKLGTTSSVSFAATGNAGTGIYFPSATITSFVSGGSELVRLQSNGLMQGLSTGDPAIAFGAAASSTVPNLIPNKQDLTTGIGAQASGNMSAIVAGVETQRWNSAGAVIISGKTFTLGNAATTGLTAGVLAALTNATIVISDSTGQAYRIPCII